MVERDSTGHGAGRGACRGRWSARRRAFAAAGLAGLAGGLLTAAAPEDLTEDLAAPEPEPTPIAGPRIAEPRIVGIPPNPIRSGTRPGDPEAGYDYLINGDYIGAGIPYDFFRTIQLGSRVGGLEPPVDWLGRPGKGRGIPHEFNVFTMPNGVDVVAGANCLACHAQVFDGELVIGLGNSLSDWTGREEAPIEQLSAVASLVYPPDSPEWASLRQLTRAVEKLEGRLATPFRGVNPAFRIEEVAAAHRVPEDLSWTEEPVFEAPRRVIASDVPAWWGVKKKRALYYNGLGRGDFTRGLQQINVVAIEDAADAERINGPMHDLLAYIDSLEAPTFPGELDPALLERGAQVFEKNCAECHGTYAPASGPFSLSGEAGRRAQAAETYPNLLVPAEIVGTDPEYARALTEGELTKWFNKSWYAKSDPTGRTRATPAVAYVAPPLDGVWSTAPYLHNGSVPTLAALLDSSRRPALWERSFRDDDYDLDAVGWRYTVPPDADGPHSAETYDTRVPGYGNGGHTYGDALGDDERRAVLEYLKSL